MERYPEDMHRNVLRSSKVSLTGGVLMAIGGLLYLNDQIASPRNWHVFLIPSLFLMGLGALLATVSSISHRRTRAE